MKVLVRPMHRIRTGRSFTVSVPPLHLLLIYRYVFLLFKQPQGFNEQKEVNSETSRSLFNISSFAEKVGLGDPLGGTFMIVGAHT